MERTLDDWRWLKEVPRPELEKALLWKEFVTPPKKHQLVYNVICQRIPRFLIFLDAGGGKSKIALDLIRYRKAMGELKAALVLVPYLINLGTWEKQVEAHAPDLKVTVLEGDLKTRVALLNESNADLFLLNYSGLPVYLAPLTQVGRRMDPGLVQQFASIFNFLVCDEIHLMGDHTSLNYALVSRLSNAADFVYALTGTPFSSDPTRLWSVFHAVDEGETLGRTLALYRAAFFSEKEDYWAGIRYEFNPKFQSHLHRMIQHRSLRYVSDELTDMPKVQEISVPVDLSKEQRAYYDGFRTSVKEAQGDFQALQNIYHKSRQTTAGFIALKGEDSKKVEVQFQHNAKLLALLELLDQFGSNKVLVYHEYIYSGFLIQQALKERRIGFVGVGFGFQSPSEQVRKFILDNKVRVFLANWKAGGTGTDGLQEVCHYGVFFESPSAPGSRIQCIRRLVRTGQKSNVTFYDLVCRDTIDEKILRYVAEGRDVYEAICDGKMKVF
jgi:SNF2 family DNA or RNA helicase